MANPSMPGLVKVGLTGYDDIRDRVRTLSAATGIPTPFQCYFYLETEPGSGRSLESAVHKCLDALGFESAGKEFHAGDLESVYQLFRGIANCKDLKLVCCKIKVRGRELDEGADSMSCLTKSVLLGDSFVGTQFFNRGLPKGYIR